MNIKNKLLLAWIATLFCIIVDAKRKYPQRNSFNKYYKTRRQQCLRQQCRHFYNNDDENCIQECVSENCYAQIYKQDPLEIGEVDKAREDRFITCVNGEAEAKRREKMAKTDL